jgi:hypothetical protein
MNGKQSAEYLLMKEEKVKALQEQLDNMMAVVASVERERDAWIERVSEIQRICRDAYEVYAGSAGIPMPETAAEAYLHQLLINMKDEIARGLSVSHDTSALDALVKDAERYKWFRSKCFVRGPECVQIIEELGGAPYVGESIEQFVDRYVDTAMKETK